ncbi:hypothetical protein L6164_029096 [Bauhinia variegata]|uniref:Uncharacterized protein n=1 Tax=Bauhinia variegata TaxID=167791 RepID=A0ACB9L860_BAUVA|nr:hypothetical protein L6164_029096 [Bauhinia variegata]
MLVAREALIAVRSKKVPRVTILKRSRPTLHSLSTVITRRKLAQVVAAISAVRRTWSRNNLSLVPVSTQVGIEE